MGSEVSRLYWYLENGSGIVDMVEKWEWLTGETRSVRD